MTTAKNQTKLEEEKEEMKKGKTILKV